MNELLTWLEQFAPTTRCSAILGRAAVELTPDTFALLQRVSVPAERVESIMRGLRKRQLGYPVYAKLAEVLHFEVRYAMTAEQAQALQEGGPYAMLEHMTLESGLLDDDEEARG